MFSLGPSGFQATLRIGVIFLLRKNSRKILSWEENHSGLKEDANASNPADANPPGACCLPVRK